jgi:hypothetical protein
MKQYAIDLFGYCVGFLGFVAKPPKSEKPIQASFVCPEPSPDDRYERGSDHRPITVHLVQVGGIALDCRPSMAGVSEHIASSERRPLGPVRIIASPPL